MTTSYKGYEITQCASDRFIIRLDGENVTTVQGSLSCAKYAIDTGYDDMTPVDTYEGLELSEDVPTSEEINEAFDSAKVCSFMEAVEANTKEIATAIKQDIDQLTDDQKHYYYHQIKMQELHLYYEGKMLDQYHEGYKQGQAELNDIVNP